MTDTATRLLWPEDVARRLRVSRRTIHKMLVKTRRAEAAAALTTAHLPMPDDPAAERVVTHLDHPVTITGPGWLPETIDRFIANRPGRGNPGKPLN